MKRAEGWCFKLYDSVQNKAASVGGSAGNVDEVLYERSKKAMAALADID
ncbi:hypothetical protein [Dyella sp. 20L07]